MKDINIYDISDEEIEAGKKMQKLKKEFSMQIEDIEPYYKAGELTEGFEGKVIGRGNVYALRSSAKAKEFLINNFG